MDQLYYPKNSLIAPLLASVLREHDITQSALSDHMLELGKRPNPGALSSFLGGQFKQGPSVTKVEAFLQCLALAEPSGAALKQFFRELEHAIRVEAFASRTGKLAHNPIVVLVLQNMEPGESPTQASVRWQKDHDVFFPTDEITDILDGAALDDKQIARLSLVIKRPKEYTVTALMRIYRFHVECKNSSRGLINLSARDSL